MDNNESLYERKLRTAGDVAVWLKDLSRAGMLWHMEDSATDIVWSCADPSGKEVRALEKLRIRAQTVCERASVCIFQLYPAEAWPESHFEEE